MENFPGFNQHLPVTCSVIPLLFSAEHYQSLENSVTNIRLHYLRVVNGLCFENHSMHLDSLLWYDIKISLDINAASIELSNKTFWVTLSCSVSSFILLLHGSKITCHSNANNNLELPCSSSTYSEWCWNLQADYHSHPFTKLLCCLMFFVLNARFKCTESLLHSWNVCWLHVLRCHCNLTCSYASSIHNNFGSNSFPCSTDICIIQSIKIRKFQTARKLKLCEEWHLLGCYAMWLL
jgi:hypothetical protein